MVKYVSTYEGYTLKKRSAKDLFDLIFVSDFPYKSICCGYSFELHRQVHAIQMGPTSYALIKKQTKSRV